VKKILIALAIIPALIWGIWIAVPESFLRDRVEGSLNKGQFTLETEGLEKKLFYKFTIDRMTLKGYGKEQVSLQNIQAPINLPAFIRFRLNVSFHGDIGRGTISGNIIRSLNGTEMEIMVENADMSGIPFLNYAGIQGSGMLSGRFTMTNGTGHLEFVTNDAQFQPVVLSDIIVPLNLFHSARGALDVKGDVIHVSSLALEGKDIYARLKGEIDNTFVDLSMEIMPGRSFLENPLFINTLERYEISPGYYVIHIKRDLRSLMNS
jgi:type II secretion system protein N